MLSGAKHLRSFPRGDSQKYSEILRYAQDDNSVEPSGALGLGSLFAPIHAARGRRFVHDDFAKTGAQRFKLFPEPRRHVLDRWIFEARNFVEIRMIELPNDWLHRVGNLRVIVDPAGRRIDLAFDRNLDLETVSVHSAALVALGRFRQGLGRFELKIFGKAHAHRLTTTRRAAS